MNLNSIRISLLILTGLCFNKAFADPITPEISHQLNLRKDEDFKALVRTFSELIDQGFHLDDILNYVGFKRKAPVTQIGMRYALLATGKLDDYYSGKYRSGIYMLTPIKRTFFVRYQSEYIKYLKQYDYQRMTLRVIE